MSVFHPDNRLLLVFAVNIIIEACLSVSVLFLNVSCENKGLSLYQDNNLSKTPPVSFISTEKKIKKEETGLFKETCYVVLWWFSLE